MKLSKRIKNPILSIETILENELMVADGKQIRQVTISSNKVAEMLDWIAELKGRELATLSLIEDALGK